ncbi:hypothetical protein E4U42_003637 [Claviceps africana]|uniref:Uncharacterized protein n=1 Tax=Claviceps africana TaxID=83212 RepID=A0A8K0JCW4_9HYPO|nr:hypothetical protein E4U42_003637 [Claviceps africana]
MCGPDMANRPRGGALAALTATEHPSPCQTSLQGDVAFHTPGHPASSQATHLRFTPSEHCSLGDVDRLRVVIHSIGDMTKAAGDCGLFRQFTLGNAHISRRYVEVPLHPPLSLEVGDHGIIGRRVSICQKTTSGSEDLVAEGIVGFNFLEPRSTF